MQACIEIVGVLPAANRVDLAVDDNRTEMATLSCERLGRRRSPHIVQDLIFFRFGIVDLVPVK